jgi:hypothetical protein
LYKYGIELSSFWINGGQIQQQCQCRILPFVRHYVRQKLKQSLMGARILCSLEIK